MIYIAYTRDSYPVSIALSANIESFRAFLQGANIDYDSIRTVDPNEITDNIKMGFVTPLLKTYTNPISKVIEVRR